MIDVLLRAAPSTAADVQLVPQDRTTATGGGVGALLRCCDAPADA